jgi:hypothetical protein
MGKNKNKKNKRVALKVLQTPDVNDGKLKCPAPSGVQCKLNHPVQLCGKTFSHSHAHSILSGEKGHIYACSEFPKTHTYALTDTELSSIVEQMRDSKNGTEICVRDIDGKLVFQFYNMVVEKTKNNISNDPREGHIPCFACCHAGKHRKVPIEYVTNSRQIAYESNKVEMRLKKGVELSAKNSPKKKPTPNQSKKSVERKNVPKTVPISKTVSYKKATKKTLEVKLVDLTTSRRNVQKKPVPPGFEEGNNFEKCFKPICYWGNKCKRGNIQRQHSTLQKKMTVAYMKGIFNPYDVLSKDKVSCSRHIEEIGKTILKHAKELLPLNISYRTDSNCIQTLIAIVKEMTMNKSYDVKTVQDQLHLCQDAIRGYNKEFQLDDDIVCFYRTGKKYVNLGVPPVETTVQRGVVQEEREPPVPTTASNSWGNPTSLWGTALPMTSPFSTGGGALTFGGGFEQCTDPPEITTKHSVMAKLNDDLLEENQRLMMEIQQLRGQLLNTQKEVENLTLKVSELTRENTNMYSKTSLLMEENGNYAKETDGLKNLLQVYMEK